MPPKKSRQAADGRADRRLLRRWVEQGATWTTHWAFEPPRKADAARRQGRGLAEQRRSTASSWPGSRPRGSQPSPEADDDDADPPRHLDLTGLPPTPGEVDAFLADASAEAYEKLVDRLLDSPRYGEHMARFWLDAARYGDTHGLHLDNYREIWPYRDWVIKAFNGNKPFDQFVVEQLAGDLLPEPDASTRSIATGFNRCHVSTSEGGSIEEEVYVRNVVDQVDTNGTVFLGLTIGCARCHDHKYDPIRTKDYYQLFAFFNNIDGPAHGRQRRPVGADRQGARRPNDKAALEAADKKIAALRQDDRRRGRPKAVAAYDGKADADQGEFVQRDDFVWIDDALPAGRHAPGGRALGVRRPARSPGPQRPGRRCGSRRRGSSSGSSTTPAGSSRSATGDTLLRLCLHRPAQSRPRRSCSSGTPPGPGRTGPTGVRT